MENTTASGKKPRCQHISKIGARCQADPQTGKDYCFFHDPDQKKKQAEARKQGGEVRSRQTEPEVTLPQNLQALYLLKASGVYDLLAQTINHFRRGEMDVRAVKSIGYLASLLLRALKDESHMAVAELVADTINQFRQGQIDLRSAKTIGNLASLMLTALKQDAAEQQGTVTNGALSSAGPISPRVQNHHNNNPEVGTSTTTATTVLPATPLDHHAPHPAAISMATANATHPEARQA